MTNVLSVLDQLSAAGPRLVLHTQPDEFAVEINAKGSALSDPDGSISCIPVHDIFSERGLERMV